MTIRQLTADDAAVYQALRLFALQESPEAFSSSPSDEADRSPEEIAARLTPAPDGSRCVFGAFARDRLAGFLAFIRPERPKLHHWADLAGMYVAPEFRRRGLGGALLDAALAHVRSLPGLRQLRLSVNASNVAARSLYQSRNFKCVGVEPEALCVEGRYYDLELYVLRLTSSPDS
jgi:ribosomal protein S18 acetylase RimI-like enzyme